MGKAFVDGVGVAFVGLADPVMQAIGIALDDVDRLIRAATVDNDIFQIVVALIQDRPEGFFEKLTLIV